MKKIAISWFELISFILVVLSGMGFWLLAEKQVLINLEQQEPKEKDFLLQVTIYESELSAIEKQLSVVQEQSLKTLLDYRKLLLSLDYVESVYPELQSTVPIPNNTVLVPKTKLQRYLNEHIVLQDDELKDLQQDYPSLTAITELVSNTQSVPLEVTVSYIDTQIQLVHTEFISRELGIQLTELINRKVNLSKDITDARNLANKEFKQALNNFEQMLQHRTLGRASFYATSFLFVSRLLIAVLLYFSRNIRESINVSLIFKLAFITLFLLFIYQAFNLLGIALASITLLFLMLPFFSKTHIVQKVIREGADNG